MSNDPYVDTNDSDDNAVDVDNCFFFSHNIIPDNNVHNLGWNNMFPQNRGHSTVSDNNSSDE